MYRELINKLASKVEVEDLELLEDIEKDFSNYVKTVSDTENSIIIARHKLEGQAYRDCIQNLDNLRRKAHNSAIVSVKALNRMCSAYKLDPIFKGNSNDRIEVANFCKDVVFELFLKRAV